MNALDQHLFLWLNLSPHAPGWLMDMARFGTTVWPTAVLLTVLAALVIGPGRWRCAALHMLLAMLVAWLVVLVIATAWPMPRPFVLGLGDRWLLKAASASFPSSHAAVAWAIGVAGCCWAKHPLVLAGFLLSASLVAWSRVALGVHFPSDMVAGMLIGAFAAWLAWRPTQLLARRLGPKFEAVALPLR
jgi:undecaprenyl-diphosphatase